jgi:exonuclease SbcC
VERAMINQVTLKNFQIHKNTEITFSPGVNVITGQSDNGKSSIVRGLSWFALNRGFSLHEIQTRGLDPKTFTSVTVEVPNHIISRMRNRDVNKYVIDGDEKKAVGNEVPEEVSSILSMTDVNIQSQMDAPYLLSSSAGEVAKAFNYFAGLGDIDTSLTAVKAKISACRQEVGSLQSQLDRVNQGLTEYENIPKIEIIINMLLSADKEMEEVEEDIAFLESSKQKMVSYAPVIQRGELAQEDKRTLAVVEGDRRNSQSLAVKITTLQNMKNDYYKHCEKCQSVDALSKMQVDVKEVRDCQQKITSLTYIHNTLDQIQNKSNQLNTCISDKQEMDAYFVEYAHIKDIEKKTQDLSSCAVQIKKLTNKIEQQGKLTESLQTEKKNLFAELGTCPLCGSVLGQQND